jgi:hypothetical protein
LLEHFPSEAQTTTPVLGYSRELWAILEAWHDRHDLVLVEGRLEASKFGGVGVGASDLS